MGELIVSDSESGERYFIGVYDEYDINTAM